MMGCTVVTLIKREGPTLLVNSSAQTALINKEDLNGVTVRFICKSLFHISDKELGSVERTF
jgi:hypothetical protein